MHALGLKSSRATVTRSEGFTSEGGEWSSCFIHLCVYMYVHTMWHTCGSQDNLSESVLSYHRVGPGA